MTPSARVDSIRVRETQLRSYRDTTVVREGGRCTHLVMGGSSSRGVGQQAHGEEPVTCVSRVIS